MAKILDLVESATDKKTKVETLVSKISKIYTPLVLVLALITAFVLPLFGLSYELSIYRALTFLVISCPCAIAISVPLSYFTGIGISSKNGILIKGSNYLDNLSNLKKIVFDKTGTLTDGLTISEIKVLDKKYSNEEVLDILLKGESLSNHPIAKSILKLKSQKIDTSKVKKFKEVEGLGISFKLGNQKIKIGNAKMCKCKNNSNLHLNINDKHIASIFLTDSIKKDAKKALEELDKLGIKTYLFTGDKKDKALEIATQLKFYDVKYEMLPEDKYNAFIELKNNEMSSFVGDGVNDAPVLKVSDIGISMGSIGQASAVEASDIVILDDDLKKIPLAIKVSNYTKLIIKENLIFALGTKIIILILSFFGLTNMLFAVFADTGVTLLAILNTLRILWKKY